MQRHFGTAAALGVLASLSMQTAQAQDVKTVIAKTNAVYQNMKTLQATFDTNIVQGPQNARIQTEVKVLSGQKASINVHQQVNGGPNGAQKSSDQRVVDDGKDIYIYVPQVNEYIKGKRNPQALLKQVASLYGLPFLSAKDMTAKLLPAKAGNKSAYIVEATSVKTPNNGKILITIDPATYHIRQTQLTGVNKGGSVTVTTLVRNEIINAPLAPALFVFTPPKGAKEHVQTPGAAPVPGGMGAPPAPRPGGMGSAPPSRPGGKP